MTSRSLGLGDRERPGRTNLVTAGSWDALMLIGGMSAFDCNTLVGSRKFLSRVSVDSRSGAASRAKDASKELQFITGFDNIVLARGTRLGDDEP